MAFIGGGAKHRSRRQEEQERATCGSSGGFFNEGDELTGDELAKFMPVHKRRLDEEAGTLNFMGGINFSNEEFFRENDEKENAASDRNSFHQSRRRQGSGRITSPRPIDFDKLLKTGASTPAGSLSKNTTRAVKVNFNDKENAASDRNSFHQSRMRRGSGRITTPMPIDFDKLLKTRDSTPSGSLFKNITTALKVNVNKADRQSQIVDDFRSTEKQISAVARRRLTGVKTPVQTNPKPVEDRRARHARSRRGGGKSRKLGDRSINLDLDIDAAKIADWDQEILAEEEVAPAPRATCGAFLAAGRSALQGNLAELDQGRKVLAVQPGALVATREDDIQVDRSEPNLHSDDPWKANSDMELSPGQSPLVEVPDVLGREKHGTERREDSGSVQPDLIMEDFVWKKTTAPDRIILEDGDDMEAVGQNLSRSSEPSRCEREAHDSHPTEIVMLDPRPRDSNNEGTKSPMTPCKVFPILGSSNLHIERIPATSPTPPSNPVAVYMSFRHLEEDLRQRKLAFHSSPSSETMESGRGQEGQKSDSGEIESPGDMCPGVEPLMMNATEVQDEKCVLEGFESRTDMCNLDLEQISTSEGDDEGGNTELVVADLGRDSYQSVLHHGTISEDDVEKMSLVGAESWIDSSDGGLHCMTPSKVKGVRMVFGEGELLRDLCKRREHQMTASKADIQDGKVVFGDTEARRNLSHLETHQTSATGDIIQVEELDNPNEISIAAPCDGGTLQEDDQVSDLPEERLLVASSDRSIHHVDDKVKTQKAGEAEKDQVNQPKKLLYCSVQSDDNESGQDQIYDSTACDRSLGGHGLQARLHDDAANDDDLEVPDVRETEPVHQNCNDTVLPEQTEPNRLTPSHADVAESVDEETIKKKDQTQTEKLYETGESEAVPACVDSQQKNATVGTVIGSDEGSTAQSLPKASKRRATKSKNGRSSLEGNGTVWTDGQRRSQRKRFTPLEWWRGEKLLYGRVHKSLTTVIGVKRSSPGKYSRGEYNPFIVESYVPDEYNELVRLAAI